MKRPHELDRTIRLVRELVPNHITDQEIIQRFQSFRVSCVADAANLKTYVGQTALVTFVNLVARMGVQVHLEMPEIRLVGPQPPLQKEWLQEALFDLGNDLIPGSWVTGRKTSRPDVRFIFGDTTYQ